MNRTLPKPPDWLHDAWESYYYVPSHDPEEAWVIDDPEELEIENIWMRHERPPPPGERGDQEDHGGPKRDPKTGRWTVNWWWIDCPQDHPDAQPFMQIRYKPL